MTALPFTCARSASGRTSRCQRRRPAAPAFTLAELLIVVALLALVLALSLPSLRRLSSKSELQNAARQLRAILLQSRLTAIESGSVTYFRYQPGAGSFEAGGGIRQQTLSADAERSSFVEPQPPNSAVATPDHAAPLQRLPLGVRFVEFSTHGPLHPPAAAGQVLGDAAWSVPILFYPNGRTRNARFALVNPSYRIELNVRGLTGTVQISPVERLVPIVAGTLEATAEAAP